eukprot:CAMPEP_0197410956 /NCGR_PEP_ID=MMETSP1165-20131217/31720_1 /TAXON_ID=284809 /ORGANISM="Chrysocystis fragilis, Strain CCMP3189" /LENGTH=119 /DNA_ID=CAMNT_0042937467 /DNA_START=77 /DNA_END=436 /DNA_ORIENTATION=+
MARSERGRVPTIDIVPTRGPRGEDTPASWAVSCACVLKEPLSHDMATRVGALEFGDATRILAMTKIQFGQLIQATEGPKIACAEPYVRRELREFEARIGQGYARCQVRLTPIPGKFTHQ